MTTPAVNSAGSMAASCASSSASPRATDCPEPPMPLAGLIRTSPPCSNRRPAARASLARESRPARQRDLAHALGEVGLPALRRRGRRVDQRMGDRLLGDEPERHDAAEQIFLAADAQLASGLERGDRHVRHHVAEVDRQRGRDVPDLVERASHHGRQPRGDAALSGPLVLARIRPKGEIRRSPVRGDWRPSGSHRWRFANGVPVGSGGMLLAPWVWPTPAFKSRCGNSPRSWPLPARSCPSSMS